MAAKEVGGGLLAVVGISLLIGLKTCARNSDSLVRGLSRGADDFARYGGDDVFRGARSGFDDAAAPGARRVPGTTLTEADFRRIFNNDPVLQKKFENLRTTGRFEFPRADSKRLLNGMPRVHDSTLLEQAGKQAAGAADETAQGAGAGAARSESVHVVAIVPQDEAAFARMFNGRSFTGSAQRQMDDFVRQVASVNADIVSEAINAQQYFTKAFSESTKNTVVVTGHSVESGSSRLLMMPGGDSISLEALDELARKAGKSCVVVTCHAPDLGLARTISFQQAGRLVSSLNNAVLEDSHQAIAKHLTSVYRKEAMTARLKVITVGAGTAGVGVLALTPDDD